jgi:hypothetical protein
MGSVYVAIRGHDWYVTDPTSRNPTAPALKPWEVLIWGQNAYCVFLVWSPYSANTTIAGVGGYIKALFRWNQDISHTLYIMFPNETPATVSSYTGMMGSGGHLINGETLILNHIAGELTFTTSTTNNEVVQVDWSAALPRTPGGANGFTWIVLAGVGLDANGNKPSYLEANWMAILHPAGPGQPSETMDISITRRDSLTHGGVSYLGALQSYADLAVQEAGRTLAQRARSERGAAVLYAERFSPLDTDPNMKALQTEKCDDFLTVVASASGQLGPTPPITALQNATTWASVDSTQPSYADQFAGDGAGPLLIGVAVQNGQTEFRQVLAVVSTALPNTPWDYGSATW